MFQYVCQKNCGVETFDQKRGEPIFLCKVCSEHREVVSGIKRLYLTSTNDPHVDVEEIGRLVLQGDAHVHTTCDGLTASATGGSLHAGMRASSGTHLTSSIHPSWSASGVPSSLASAAHSFVELGAADNGGGSGGGVVSAMSSPITAATANRQRQLPIPPDQQQR